MLLCAAVLCLLLLSLNSSKAEGIPTTTDARIAAKKFQNALSQQSLQTVLSSIEERLRNLDAVYAMQYSPTVEGKLETYGRKLESVEAKIERLEAIVGNELDTISENISGRNFKDDLAREHVLRKIDAVFDRINHRLIFAESKMELMERKLENKLDTILSRMEKMEDSLEIKDADMQGEISDVLTGIEELKTQSDCVEQKLQNISKALNHESRPIQSDETASSLTNENITATLKKDMKEHFEVLSNKIVDFHETSWQTYDRLERTLRSMSLVSNLTRYEIQNGLRSLTVEVGRLSGGQGLLSDSSKEKSKLQEIDKKIDSNFESLMLAQNLFMENCYRLQKDEPQLETKISEVLNEMINTFKAKTAVAPKDIRRLEQALKTHDASMRNGFKNLDTILQKSQLTDLNIQESLNSLYSIKANLIRLNTIITSNSTEISRLGDRLQEVIQLFKNLQTDASPSNLLEIKLNEIAEKLENLTQTSDEETVLNYVRDHVENMGKIIEDIGNKTERINFIFTDHYKQHLQLFLDEYAEDYLRRITELFNGSQNFDNGIKQMTNSTIEAIKRECFVKNKPDCLEGILDEDQRKAVKIYCIFNTSLTEKDCLKKLINTSESLPEESHSIILENCLKFGANLTNFNCLNGVMKEAEIELIKTYCGLFFRAENDPQGACLRNITKLKIRTDFDRDTLEKIESNCFPSLDIRSGGNFQCLTRIFSNELVQDIRNYCQFHGYDSEENCLRKITNLEDPNVTAAKQLLESNCLLIDVKVARNLSILDCARKILDEDSILALRNYCSARMDLEDCLRSIIGVEKHITAEIKEVIKRNCFPDFDIRTTTKFACISQVVSEDNIRIIEDYCSAKLFLDETDCLRSVISKDNSIKFDIRKRESDAADIATITTEEADYFQPTEATERAEYEDYNLRSY